MRANSMMPNSTSSRFRADHAMSNNFAFGGVNTSLVFKRWAG
jgi:3-oxoacyl-(acyl-carrier-protein) synthase